MQQSPAPTCPAAQAGRGAPADTARRCLSAAGHWPQGQSRLPHQTGLGPPPEAEPLLSKGSKPPSPQEARGVLGASSALPASPSPAGQGLPDNTPHAGPHTTQTRFSVWESKVNVLENSVPGESSLHPLVVGREGEGEGAGGGGRGGGRDGALCLLLQGTHPAPGAPPSPLVLLSSPPKVPSS